MIVLIAKNKILKVVPTAEQAFYWADLLAPESDYYVDDLGLQAFMNFTLAELRQMYSLHQLGICKDSWGQEIIAGALLTFAQGFEPDSTEVWELRNKLGRDVSSPTVTPVTDKQRASLLGNPEGNPEDGKARTGRTGSTAPANSKRPRAGTASAAIWDKADELKTRIGVDVTDVTHLRGLLINWGEEQQINPSTVRTQYNHWRRFNSL